MSTLKTALLAAALTLLPLLGERARGENLMFPADGRNTEVLTLERAIEMALSNNLDARYDRVTMKIDRERIRYAWGAFDPKLALNVGRESTLRPQNQVNISAADAARQQQAFTAQQELTQAIQLNTAAIQAQNALLNGQPVPSTPDSGTPTTGSGGTTGTDQSFLLYDQQNIRASTGLESRTPFGTRFSLSVEANRFRAGIKGEDQQDIPEFVSFAGISVTQPLLRDFGPAANLVDVRVARKNREVSFLSWQLRVINTVQTVMVTYLEMLYAIANVRVRQEALEADQQLAYENQRRFELGFMSPLDVRQAQVAVSTDEEELLSAKNFFMERQFALKRQILSELDLEDNRLFMPTGGLRDEVPRINRTELMRTAYAKRLDYQSALKEAEVQDIRIRFARNQLWPRVDLVGTYGYNGLSDSYGSSLSEALRGDAPQFTLGVVASVPLGNVEARAQLAAIKGFKEQAILRIKQTELTVSVDVDTVISRIQTNLQRVTTSRESRRLGEEAVRVGRKRLEEGQISSFDILEVQRRLYDARTRELAAMAELNKSVVQLGLATGTLLEKQGITLFDDKKSK